MGQGAYRLEQPDHARHLQRLTPDAKFDSFRSLRHQLAWLGQTRPDLVSVANICSQVTTSNFGRAHIKMLNDGVSHAHATQHLGLGMHPLHRRTLNILVYADASFGNNWDHSTQLEFFVFLTDGTARCNPIYYSS